jgi:hypothetical protein
MEVDPTHPRGIQLVSPERNEPVFLTSRQRDQLMATLVEFVVEFARASCCIAWCWSIADRCCRAADDSALPAPAQDDEASAGPQLYAVRRARVRSRLS